MSVPTPTFFIGSIRINSVEGASSVNFGNNWLTDFTSYKKHNQGLGNISGDHNDIQGLRSLLNDSDIIDMINDPDEQAVPEWLQQFLTKKLKEDDDES